NGGEGTNGKLPPATNGDAGGVRVKDKSAVLAAVADHLKEHGAVRITAPGAADIRAALGLAREFKFRLLLVDPSNLDAFRDQLPAWRDVVAGVILNAEVRPGKVGDFRVPDKDDPKNRLPWENARDLLAAGLKVAIRPAADDDLDDTLFVGGLFTGGGLSAHPVLQMLTGNAAELLGVADRGASPSWGQDADF